MNIQRFTCKRFSSFVRKTPERKTHARTVYVAHLSASKGREQSVRSDCAVHPSLFDVDQMQKTRVELCVMLFSASPNKSVYREEITHAARSSYKFSH